ncbi:DDE transposase [Paraferrimonas sedimenticola]|uniref:DDE transposase n=1 Tax=Paraferrimonas sedimenticola TaxID=375674 RepID=A0AA37W0V8_9GAMM|nr:DDE transposase [Paraferrimonas sedimenticola]
MLKLYLYGYLNRIQSSRRLEREAQRNVELMWLTGRLAPDFKTIADFRKNNGKGIKNACRTFISICRDLNMFKDAVIAIDGSKFKAVNNKSKNFTSAKLKSHITRVEKHIQQYLDALDNADNEDEEPRETIQQRIAHLKGKLKEYKALQKQVEAIPDKQLSQTDPDARLMKLRSFGGQVCYNVQSAVDAKHHLIVAHEVTNVPDRNQLYNVGCAAQEALANTNITVLADKGYYSGVEIKSAKDAGMLTYVPKTDTSGSNAKKIFNRTQFKYDAAKDVYHRPGDQELKYRGSETEKGKLIKRYYADVYACRGCSLKSQCTTSPYPRRLGRWEHEQVLVSVQRRLNQWPEAMLIRKQTVEHPFGTIKMWMGATHFLTRGFNNVKTEMNLSVLAYNLRRMISLLGVKPLIEAMRAV